MAVLLRYLDPLLPHLQRRGELTRCRPTREQDRDAAKAAGLYHVMHAPGARNVANHRDAVEYNYRHHDAAWDGNRIASGVCVCVCVCVCECDVCIHIHTCVHAHMHTCPHIRRAVATASTGMSPKPYHLNPNPDTLNSILHPKPPNQHQRAVVTA